MRAALWASQFRNDCSRLLLFEDDMSGCGLGFTSALIENLLLYAVAQNRVLIEVPVNSSWHNVRGHMPFNEGRKPCSAEPAVVRRRPRHAPVLLLPPHALRGAAYPYAHGATFGSWREHPQQQPDQRGGARVAVQAHVVLQNPRNRRIRERCEARGGTLSVAASRVGAPHRRVRDAAQHDLQPRRDAQPANFVSIFIRESAEKDRELRKYNHGIVPRAAWPSVSQRVAEQLGVRRVFLQTSSASAAVAYTNATTPLGLVVSFTENRRSEHDEWGGWSNSTNAIIQQGTIAAVNLYIASQAAALASPSMTSWTRFLEAGMPGVGAIAPPPPLQLGLCCRCTKHDGGGGDLAVIIPRQSHADSQALATLHALKNKAWMPCKTFPNRSLSKPEVNATAAPDASTAASSVPDAPTLCSRPLCSRQAAHSRVQHASPITFR